jgi:hypothetical protein
MTFNLQIRVNAKLVEKRKDGAGMALESALALIHAARTIGSSAE